MILPFVEIYFLATICLFLIVFDPSEMEGGIASNIRNAVPFLSFIELVIGAIVNWIWLKQSFWLDVLLPIILISLVLVLELNALMFKEQKLFLFTKAKNHFKDKAFYYNALLSHPNPVKHFIFLALEKIIYVFLIFLISSLSFALVKFNVNALIASIPILWRINLGSIFSFLTRNDQSILTLNSFLFVTSLLGILALYLCFILLTQIEILSRQIGKIFRQRESRRYQRTGRPRYDTRRHGRCSGIGCEECNHTGKVKILSPSIECTSCWGMGWISQGGLHGYDRPFPTECSRCKGMGWITDSK